MLGCAPPQDAIYGSIAQDFADSAAAWDLQARRHALGVPEGASAAVAHAALQAALAVYERGLEAVPTPEMTDLLAVFLREQLGALQQQQAGEGDAARLQLLHDRLLQLCAQAAAEGRASEALLLEWPAAHLHFGEREAARAAALAAVQALPSSAAAWQQLIQLEAFAVAQQLLDGSDAVATPGGPSSSSSSGDDDSDADEAAGHRPFALLRAGHQAAAEAGPRRQLDALVLRALRAVPAASSAALWLEGLAALVGCACSLEAYCQLLADSLAGLARGPVEVRGAVSMRVLLPGLPSSCPCLSSAEAGGMRCAGRAGERCRGRGARGAPHGRPASSAAAVPRPAAVAASWRGLLPCRAGPGASGSRGSWRAAGSRRRCGCAAAQAAAAAV